MYFEIGYSTTNEIDDVVGSSTAVAYEEEQKKKLFHTVKELLPLPLCCCKLLHDTLF